jgi:hypothetical protein
MAPATRTAEYVLLSRLAEGRQPTTSLNRIALDKAMSDHLCISAIGWTVLTKRGYDRLEELNDQ